MVEEAQARLAQPQSPKAFPTLLRVAASLMAAATLTVCVFVAKVDAQDHVNRWRVNWNGELYASEFEQTDAIGRVSMSCPAPAAAQAAGQAPGAVEVTVLMRSEQLQAFGNLIASEAYPRVKLEGDADGVLLISKLEYTESLPGGWQYSFYGRIDSPAMDRFEQTGTLNFEIEGGIKDGVSLDQGLDAVAEFRSRCRHLKK